MFISTPSFVLEVNVNVSTMQFDSDDDGSHDIGVVKLAGMDEEGERNIFISHESGHRCRPLPHLPRRHRVSVSEVLMVVLCMDGGSPPASMR